MKTLLVPKFKVVWPVGKKHHEHEFVGYVEVKVKYNPDSEDYQKVTAILPGLACGFCQEFFTITKTGKPIEIIHFYDIRQGGVKKLKGYFITVK